MRVLSARNLAFCRRGKPVADGLRSALQDTGSAGAPQRTHARAYAPQVGMALAGRRADAANGASSAASRVTENSRHSPRTAAIRKGGAVNPHALTTARIASRRRITRPMEAALSFLYKYEALHGASASQPERAILQARRLAGKEQAMSEHYYTPSPASAHDERRLTVRALGVEMSFVTDSGVFSRDGLDAGTRVLLEALPPLSGRVLDLGCGWGAMGGVLAKVYPDARFVLSDINARAVELAARNLRANGLRNARAVCGDGFAAVEGCFDWILTNPPIRAGKQVIYGLFAQARDFLAPGGTLALVIRTQQGAKSAERFLRGLYASVKTLDISGGYRVLAADGGTGAP